MSFARRRLPHIHPPGKWLFITWHLDGSLPQALFSPAGKTSDGKVFVWMDRYLDSARTGPTYLLQPEIAEIVAGSIQRGVSLGHYELRAWVVMANHVHVLLLPLISPSRLMQFDQGVYGATDKLDFRPNGAEILAGGIVRSLGQGRFGT